MRLTVRDTVIRMPRMHARPPMSAGSKVILSNMRSSSIVSSNVLSASALVLLPHAEQRILPPQVNLAIQNRRRSDEGLTLQRIRRQHLERLAHFHDDHVAILGGEIQLPVGPHRRRLEVVRLGQSLLLIVRLAGLCIET